MANIGDTCDFFVQLGLLAGQDIRDFKKFQNNIICKYGRYFEHNFQNSPELSFFSIEAFDGITGRNLTKCRIFVENRSIFSGFWSRSSKVGSGWVGDSEVDFDF